MSTTPTPGGDKRIVVYRTHIHSTPKTRANHEVAERALRPYEAHVQWIDIASDETAKATWRRLAQGSTELPLICTDGQPVGSIEQLSEAVEFGEVRQFLRLDQQPAADNSEADLNSLTGAEAAQLARELDDMEIQQQFSPAEARKQSLAIDTDDLEGFSGIAGGQQLSSVPGSVGYPSVPPNSLANASGFPQEQQQHTSQVASPTAMRQKLREQHVEYSE